MVKYLYSESFALRSSEFGKLSLKIHFCHFLQLRLFVHFSTTVSICPMCQDKLGSCNLFKTYEPVIKHLKKQFDADYNENNSINDFFLTGSICAMAADPLAAESFWLVNIVSVNVTAPLPSPFSI